MITEKYQETLDRCTAAIGAIEKQPISYYQAIDSFRVAMANAGMIVNSEIIADGNLHRCHVEGDKAGSKNGAYILHIDDRPAGWYQHFKTGINGTWSLSGQREPLSFAMKQHIEAARLQRETERRQEMAAAALKAQRIWQLAPFATQSNGYLTRKKVQPHSTKQGYNGALICPIFDKDLRLVNLQLIQPEKSLDGRDKNFLTGGQKQHCFWWLGVKTDTVLLAEGFATAASLHEATGMQTFIAFDAGNLSNVATIIRQKRPMAEIIVCGDNDLSGVGQKAARTAALACGGKYLLPPIVGTDFNDVLSTEA